MIHDEIKEKIKDAMRAKDQVRLSVLRNILTAFTNELVATKRTPQDKLSDEEALKVIQKLAKQRKDSISQFEQGGRSDLANDEKLELAIIQEFLPEMMSEEEIKKVVEKKKVEMNISDKSELGMFIGSVMKELGGLADGSLVKDIVEGMFD
jgi:uncharacterized protein